MKEGRLFIDVSIDLTKHVKPLETKPAEVKKVVPKMAELPAVPFTTLTSYSFYESGKKHVKVLVALDGVEKHPGEKIKVEFKPRSFAVSVLDMKGKNYVFRVPKLQCNIKPEQSMYSFKTNQIVVTLCKEKDDDHWWSLFKSKGVCEVDSD